MAKTYREKLLDPRWQRKRLEILERDQWQCYDCGDDKSTLHVHHRYYVRGREPWDYPNDALVSLCETCHGNNESTREALAVSMARLDENAMVLGYVNALQLTYSREEDPSWTLSCLSYEWAAGFADGIGHYSERTFSPEDVIEAMRGQKEWTVDDLLKRFSRKDEG